MDLYKMVSLVEYLRSKNLFAAEQLDFWMQSGKANRTAKSVGDGIVLCRFEYDAVISIERYAKSANLFLALITCWLMDNDPSRDDDGLSEPDIDVTPLDDGTADVEVTITFNEDITARLDPNGDIDFNGARYSLAPVEIQIANAISVGDHAPLDAEYVRPEN